ncbi:hypothetical protein LH991_16330 [Schleiferilactobacillus harbinensis]|uniref:hypothetical protein n=1 Tax=Schleiferilactobacillus harbinensis TaxID=304207 RepID=UPI0004850D76|nr:hypothetical protein [Schleiferilactobacillus harbinensis]QFR62529.1 hypothetical protein LH991_00180 [Schleiferilactobacillus harbinensis]QFR65390.1 hypothetical protein LH991_16330 [Schleiferilactobacillus harbinensis]
MDDCISDLLGQVLNIAYDNDIAVIMRPFHHPDTPPCADCETRTIILNSNWREHNALPMHAAHEVEHILNGDTGTLYYHNCYAKYGSEGAANRGAVGILVPLYFADVEPEDANLFQFMDNLCIPSSLESWVNSTIQNFYLEK